MNRLKRVTLRSMLLLFSGGLLALAGSVLAQNGPEEYPPNVIDVWPYPGEEVATDQAVSVTFDQAMDRASVEAAWTMDPALPGEFQWQDDRTVSFLPTGGWQRATRYQVTIGTGAQSTGGVALEGPYSFDVQTIGILNVSAVIPAPGAEGVAADATITVSFNRPVVPLVSTEQMADLPSPLTFDPAIEGKGEWINTSIYQFTPSKPLSGATTYTVTIPAGLTDVTGSSLDEPYTWQFKTLAPEILDVSPYQGEMSVLLDRVITINFSQPMDRASTEAAFALMAGGEPVAGSFEWSNEGSTLTFRPAAPLKIETMYALVLAPSARSASGEATLQQGINYSFNTIPYPGIQSTWPANGETNVSPGSGVTINFKSPMNTETFRDKAEVKIAGSDEKVEWTPVVQGDWSFYLSFATLPEKTYLVTFKRGAEDIYGNAIDTDYTFSFSTGRFEPWASLPSSGSFVITNAYREDTRLAMSVSGQPQVGFALYRVPPPYIGLAMRGYYYGDETNITQVSELIRNWTEQLDPGPTQQGVDDVLLASPEGGRLTPGVYYLQAMLPGYDYPQTLALGVVTANLTVKRAPDEALIWVTDIQSAEPIAGTTVSVFAADGTLIASGQTDAQGIFRSGIQLPSSDNFIYATAESQDVYGVWSSWGTSTPPNVAAYVYTDRPIYRPGETVYFRGAVRDREDMNYMLPRGVETVHISVSVNYGEQVLFEDDPVLTEFGTFSGEFDLPDDVQLGDAVIAIRYRSDYDGQVNFNISEFRVPEYKVEVTADYPSIIQGDPLKAVAAASYYFGGAVSNAPLDWTAYGDASYFNYTGPGSYRFDDETQDYFSYATLAANAEPTNASGQVVMDVPNTRAPSIRPMTITLEGTVVDESGQYISGRTTVLAHPAEVYVGLRTDRYFGTEKEPLTIDLIAVTPESEPLADKTIELSVVEIRWERVPIEGQFGQYDWQYQEIEVQTDRVKTDREGKAQYVFTPPQAGMYRVRALARDDRERVNSSSLRFWVTGSTPVWWGRPTNQVDLVADKDSYQPGDTAEVLVPIPFSGVSWVLVTVERAGIQHYEVIRVEGSTLVYKLPLTDQHVPTVYVSVVLLKGTDEENLNPSFRTGTLSLNIEPVNQRLNVMVTPSATMAQPGETVTIDVKTTDAHGEPVSAEVGIGVTDQAILSLMPPNSVPLEDYFYGTQSDYVYTEVALNGLIDTITDEILKQKDQRQAAQNATPSAQPTMTAAFAADGMVAEEAAAPMAASGGGPGQPPVAIRQDFQQTPLWAPHVVTDAAGQGSVTLTLPDNLTTWELDARGLTVTTEVGDATVDIVSTRPLLTRPVAPRFFVVGDRVTLASVINNNTDGPQEVQATLDAKGVTLDSDATQTVTIEAGQRARVEWVVTVEDVPNVDLTFYAIGQGGYQDAAKPMLATGPNGTIPVYRYTAPDTVGTGGILREQGSRTEAISLPPRLDTSRGELTIHVDPSLAVTTVDSLDYLKNFPHQCIEQTISRFLPNVMTYRALKSLGIDDPALAENLRAVLDQALARLAQDQNADGGWGWFGLMESNPYVTAYAALGLVEARDGGFSVDQVMIDRALNFVRLYLIRPGIDTPRWELNRQAFYLYVFARAGQAKQADLDALLDQRLEMDLWARSFLLMAYHQMNPADPAIPQLVSDLTSAAILSATGAHWEEAEVDWWNWNSDTRTTAITLGALARVVPDSDLLPNVVRWLMVARQGDHWETTQETAWAVMSLTDWMVTTGELKGSYDYAVTLNREPLTEGTVTPDTVRQGQVLQVQVKDLLQDEANRLTFIRGEGNGVLYYTAHLNVRLPAAEVKPISRGITVSREFFRADESDTPISTAQVGDVITVRVTITLPQDIYYFVLEDPIPAGTEGVDTSLLTTSQLLEPPTIKPTYDPWWYWGWWYFDRTEMHDEQVNLYADYLPSGTYVYTYQVRATIPGEFQTMPSHAYAFYFPEVFGRGAGSLFTITAGD